MLRSSIMGREFINYRKNTDKNQRNNFSGKVRSRGMGYVPIVVDSVDPELSNALASKDANYSRNIKYGFEVIMHMDKKVIDLLKEVKIELLKKDCKNIDLVLGLESGDLIDLDMDIGTVYKEYRNKDDKILYVLATKEQTMYGYIMSIIKYLANNITTFIKEKIIS